MAGVQREEGCKQLKVPGLCSCLFGTCFGPTCSVDGHNPLLGAGQHERSPVSSSTPPVPGRRLQEQGCAGAAREKISLHSVISECLRQGRPGFSFSKGGLWRTKIKLCIFFPIRGPSPSSPRESVKNSVSWRVSQQGEILGDQNRLKAKRQK